MEKIFVYSSDSLKEFPASSLHAVQLEVELFNRDENGMEKKKIYQGSSFPPEGFKFESGELKPFTLSEKADRGLIAVPEDQKVEGNQLVPKTVLELLQCGQLTISEYKEKKIRSINSKFDEAMEKILCLYPKTEPLSWPILTSQSKVWKDSSSEERESLKLILTSLVNESASLEYDDITELADRILIKSRSFEAYIGICKRMKRVWVRQIENNTKTNVSVLFQELESLSIEFPEFKGEIYG
ncbi:hypothetical protein [Leptospira stimsonii]|uniref:Uncharacterized protein n=1 Tax=Leptospira stimsonii TaxID=2202203 RepID=A0A8B3CV99_9LEPT|nr:hypothetical protein [Leptospira stimsonii]RHX87612.1 hypothetical protein DLM78_00995 [Leptospira stimsonii]